MTVLKWLLIIFGVLFLAFMAVVIGGYYWASTVESVKLTAADMEVGGSYPPDERQALLGACQKSGVAGADASACTCVADKAGTESSRFERLVVTGGLGSQRHHGHGAHQGSDRERRFEGEGRGHGQGLQGAHRRPAEIVRSGAQMTQARGQCGQARSPPPAA